MAPKVDPIAIIGAGPAGCSAALALDRLVGDDVGQPIYLFNESATFSFAPYLFDLFESGDRAARRIAFDDIFAGTRVRFLAERVTAVDAETNHLMTEKRQVKFGDLVVATGAETVVDNNRSKAWISDSIADMARVTQELADHGGPGYVTIVGGGLRGIDVALAFSGWLWRHVSAAQRANVYVTLLHRGARPAPELPVDVSRQLIRLVRSFGVSIQLNKARTWSDHVRVQSAKNGRPAHLAIWATGLSACRLAGARFRLGVTDRFAAGPTLSLAGQENIWAAGSCLELAEPATRAAAWRQGQFVARQIARRRAGRPLETYRPTRPAWLIKSGPGQYVGVTERGLNVGFGAGLAALWHDFWFLVRLVPAYEAVALMVPGRGLA